MKFNKALDEATETITKKETASFTSQKKKEWKNKKNKKNSGVTAVSSEDTGITGDYEKMFKKK